MVNAWSTPSHEVTRLVVDDAPYPSPTPSDALPARLESVDRNVPVDDDISTHFLKPHISFFNKVDVPSTWSATSTLLKNEMWG